MGMWDRVNQGRPPPTASTARGSAPPSYGTPPAAPVYGRPPTDSMRTQPQAPRESAWSSAPTPVRGQPPPMQAQPAPAAQQGWQERLRATQAPPMPAPMPAYQRPGQAPPMQAAPQQPPNRQQQIRAMMAQVQARNGRGGSALPAPAPNNPYEKFNDRGKPVASRVNLIGNQMPTYRQKLWGGMRGNPGQPRAGQPLMGG